MSSLFTVTSIGEVWDVLCLMKSRLLRKAFLPLLFQSIAVVLVTTISMLSGPIARYSLRNAQEILVTPVDGLLGAAFPEMGPYGHMTTGNVLWNRTLDSLIAANFPTDQLLDYLPSLTVPWIYNPTEWNATWTASCTDTERTYLNITADKDHNIYDPINAFPEFGRTFDPIWTNQTQYRYSVDLCGWEIYQKNGSGIIQDFAFFVLLETEPTLDEQMFKNSAPLHISLTVLHVRNALMPDGQLNFASGPAGLSDFTRTECLLTRRPDVPDTGYIAWPWTNQTAQIVSAFADYYRYNISLMADKKLVVPPLAPKEIFRFYQAYLVSYLILNEYPVTRSLSVLTDVIQLSTITLVIILFLVLCMIGILSRYVVFRRRHSKDLVVFQVPEAKLDWFLYTFKGSRHVMPHELALANRDLFADAVYGQEMTSQAAHGGARVFSRRQSDIGGAQLFLVSPRLESSKQPLKKTTTTSVTEEAALPDDLSPGVNADADADGQTSQNEKSPTGETSHPSSK